MYNITDISNWTNDYSLQVSGTREKYWLKPETDDANRYLFKVPKVSNGEIWAEKVSSELGKMLHLKMMNVEFAEQNGRKGVILENFISKTEGMADGGEILSTILDEFNPWSLDQYSIENIMISLQPFGFEKDFVSLCVFDCLIANQDRHCENWAVVLSDGTPVFSPIFDNGASLGFNVGSRKLEDLMKDERMFKGFTNRSKTLIEVEQKKKPKVLKLLNYLKEQYPCYTKDEIRRIGSLDLSKLSNILNKVPLAIMSVLEKEWVLKLIHYRKQWMLEWYKGG
ncbi:HipA domain-containing protein [Halobacillus amylolyticus]|uniref:HipA domain-containing protein n=1 Tax=Halobacillus amylolyticus TaxID=2932259 RepID=A0ABY4H6C5_9BACI|nr:HipA domain-containing protein [Halobacillus amylolyticus]UOR10259.1 HipA domain-containing protein [Halobacillus amylolyticus]